ncbi:MAG: hypothetical protein JXJ22_17765 [Bacteroidales bacterium]|nr:hypothetical protein [Bacteroidales bacterium]
MLNFFNKIFNIRRHEIGVVILISILALLVGAFMASFDIGAHTFFFDHFEISDIPLAFCISGITGLIIFILYTFLSTRLPGKFFVFLCFFLVFAGIISLNYYIEYVDIELGAYIGFIIMFPVTIVTGLSFRQLIQEFLLPEQRKRMEYIIYILFLGGLVAASYSIILLMFAYPINSILLLAASAITLVLVLTSIILLFSKAIRGIKPVNKKPLAIRSGFFQLFSTKYTTYLFLFGVVSAIVAFLIHLIFLNLTRASYPSIIGFTKFMGLFLGTLYVFIFVAEHLLVHRVLYSYDSPYSLVLVPIGTFVMLLISVLIYVTLGTSTAIARFTFFFMLIGISKMVYETARYTIQHPSVKVLLLDLDPRYRQTIVPFLEGIAVMLGLTFSGMIIYFIEKLNFVHLVHYVILVLPFLILWFFICVRLIKFYQASLKDSIRKLKVSRRSVLFDILSLKERINQFLNSKSPEKIIHTLNIAEEIEPIGYEQYLIRLLSNSSEPVHKYAIKKIDAGTVLQSLPVLKTKIKEIENIDLKEEFGYVIQKFENKLSLGSENEQLSMLLNSHKVNERIIAAEIIGSFKKTEYSNSLINLVRDFEPGVKFAAIKAMAQLGSLEHAYMLIGYLSSSKYYSIAFEALINIGEGALDYLEQVFLSPDSRPEVLSRIIKIYGRIGGTKATDLLVNKIENQTKEISRLALQALVESKYQAGSLNLNRILNSIVKEIMIISWNLSAYYTIGRAKNYRLLSQAFLSEINKNYLNLYNLLSLAYNANTIASLKEKIEHGDQSDNSYAIEMLDQFIYEDIKQVLFPLLENITTRDRIKKLQYYFPDEKMDVEELIPSIITRDYNMLSLYTKACAVKCLLNQKNTKISQELISNLFSPHKLLREISAIVINKADPVFLESIYPRLDESIVQEMINLFHNLESNEIHSLLNKILFLKKNRHFSLIDEDILLKIADKLLPGYIKSGEKISITDCSDTYTFVIVYEGTLTCNLNENKNIILSSNDILYPQIIIDQYHETLEFEATADTIIFSLERETFNLLLFDNIELTNLILKIVEDN